MKIVYPDLHSLHRPDFYYVRGVRVDPREIPDRAEILLAAATRAGHEVVAPDAYGAASREAVHTRAYLDYIESAYGKWEQLPGASAQIMPSIHPVRHMTGFPDHVVGQTGWFVADTSCPIGPGTWTAACQAGDAAVHAAMLVAGGERAAYALCRPPGHHCFADLAGGFCYLNNIAIAAEHLRRSVDRVAIVDVDVHHGNGTQGIFYDRGDVFFGSVHADPASFYPFFAGYAEETGTGDGEGATLNKPLAQGSGDEAYLGAIAAIAEAVDRFDPDIVLVSLGLDASDADPFGGLAVTTEGFRKTGALLAGLGRPLVLVQEGGYISPVLGANLVACLDGVESAL